MIKQCLHYNEPKFHDRKRIGDISVKNKIFHTQDLCLRTNLICAKGSAGMENRVRNRNDNVDEGLEGNERLEEAIAALQMEPSEEMLAHVLTVVRQRMREGGQFIVAVDPKAGDAGLSIQAVKTDDGRMWWSVFTSFDEELKGSGSVMSTFMSGIGQILKTAGEVEGISGIIINPWNRTLMLDKNLINIILGAK